jgi:hypothetical protein
MYRSLVSCTPHWILQTTLFLTIYKYFTKLTKIQTFIVNIGVNHKTPFLYTFTKPTTKLHERWTTTSLHLTKLYLQHTMNSHLGYPNQSLQNTQQRNIMHPKLHHCTDGPSENHPNHCISFLQHDNMYLKIASLHWLAARASLPSTAKLAVGVPPPIDALIYHVILYIYNDHFMYCKPYLSPINILQGSDYRPIPIKP